jgi:hypothetical protein
MQPCSSPAPRRRRRLAPTVFVLVIATITLSALGAAAFYKGSTAPVPLRFFDPRRSPTFDESWIVSVMDYAFSSNETNDVVFLGDSACRTGIDPILIERLTGLRAYNLGIVGDLGPSVMLDVAKAYLLNHPAPRLVVLCVSPAALRRDVPQNWKSLQNHCASCFTPDSRDFASIEAGWEYNLKHGTVMAWQRLVSPLHDVRDNPLLGMGKETYRTFELSMRKARGYVPLNGGYPIEPLIVEGDIVSVHKVWDAGVRRLAEACDKAQIPFLLCFAPIAAEASKALNFDSVERWREGLSKSCPHLLLPPHREILRYPNDLCWNGTHVNVTGAAQFTARIAKDLRAALEQSGAAQPK